MQFVLTISHVPQQRVEFYPNAEGHEELLVLGGLPEHLGYDGHPTSINRSQSSLATVKTERFDKPQSLLLKAEAAWLLDTVGK